jgi:hypothetical protein
VSGASRARRAPLLVAATAAALALALAVAVAGCAGFSADPTLRLGLENATDRPVLVYVNGEWVGTFAAGAQNDDIPSGAHGGPPWRLEARTDAGVVLVTAEVAAAPPSGTGTGATAGTACGDISLWAGDTRPDVQPSDAPATLPPCD